MTLVRQALVGASVTAIETTAMEFPVGNVEPGSSEGGSG